jgi:aspartyl-tRNA synthetase
VLKHTSAIGRPFVPVAQPRPVFDKIVKPVGSEDPDTAYSLKLQDPRNRGERANAKAASAVKQNRQFGSLSGNASRDESKRHIDDSQAVTQRFKAEQLLRSQVLRGSVSRG